MNSGRGRRLRDDESELWKGFTRTIKPLKPKSQSDREPQAAIPSARKTSTECKPATKPATIAAAPAKPATSQIPTFVPLGRRIKQRLARGTDAIDARLDLHGRTQAQAHHALLGFLRSAQAQGAKNVLVITGKGARATDGERGVLKRQVPLWLRLPEFRAYVVGFEDAHVGHGGQGALYVRVRKLKE